MPGLANSDSAYETIEGAPLPAVPAASLAHARRWLQAPASSSTAAAAALERAGGAVGFYCFRKGSQGVVLVAVGRVDGDQKIAHFRIVAGQDGSFESPDMNAGRDRRFPTLEAFLAFHHDNALGGGIAHPLTQCLPFAAV